MIVLETSNPASQKESGVFNNELNSQQIAFLLKNTPLIGRPSRKDQYYGRSTT